MYTGKVENTALGTILNLNGQSRKNIYVVNNDNVAISNRQINRL